MFAKIVLKACQLNTKPSRLKALVIKRGIAIIKAGIDINEIAVSAKEGICALSGLRNEPSPCYWPELVIRVGDRDVDWHCKVIADLHCPGRNRG
jgi:hypothetical protein